MIIDDGWHSDTDAAYHPTPGDPLPSGCPGNLNPGILETKRAAMLIAIKLQRLF